MFAFHSTNLQEENVEGEEKALMATYRFASELLYNVDVQIQSFTQEDYTLSYRNHFAESFYSDLLPQTYKIEEWLETCHFEQQDASARILSSIKALKLGSAPLVFDCFFVPSFAQDRAQLRTDSKERVWHRVKVNTIHDPNSSQMRLLVQQSDVTAHVRQAELQV